MRRESFMFLTLLVVFLSLLGQVQSGKIWLKRYRKKDFDSIPEEYRLSKIAKEIMEFLQSMANKHDDNEESATQDSEKILQSPTTGQRIWLERFRQSENKELSEALAVKDVKKSTTTTTTATTKTNKSSLRGASEESEMKQQKKKKKKTKELVNDNAIERAPETS